MGMLLLFPLPLEAARSASDIVKDKDGRWLSGFSVEDGRWRVRANLSDIDTRFVERLIAIEDARFYHHGGVDIWAVARAARSWHRAGKPVSGASTMTMQLVRQIEPRPRTLRSKAIEMLRAVQYELFLSKDEILELYLTHISYGGNIEGVYAASLAYFGKPPERLTDSEIALLIAIPQSPEVRRPDRKLVNALKARNAILAKLGSNGHMSPVSVQEALQDPMQQVRFDVPDTAWVTANSLRHEQISNSSLDITLQSEIEGLVKRRVKALGEATNIAAIIVENETMAVRAHIATTDRQRPGGWIDMTRQVRSPGSTLKPLIYGLAMDDGIANSGTIIRDAPTRFRGYQPENFDRMTHGDVRLHEALRHSLNIPAVVLLDKIGSTRFEDSLRQTGIDLVRPGAKTNAAGLALALGGAGVELNDLAVMYAMFANEGVVHPLQWGSKAKKQKGKQILSPETAAEITHILRQSPTPEGHAPSWVGQNMPDIAYKTGTSYGFRDAWAAGYTDRWTVIVWVGRPDGAPRPGETGRKAAAPILYDIFSRLPHRGGQNLFVKDAAAPDGLKRVSSPGEDAPQMTFPPHEAELFAATFGSEARGFTLSAFSHHGGLSYYVDGEPVAREAGRAIWRPDGPGFYTVKVVDKNGKSDQANIQVKSFSESFEPGL